MEGDLAVERAEGRKSEYAPSSDMPDSVKVEGHICDYLESKRGPSFLQGVQTVKAVSKATLQYYSAQCSVCCLLWRALDANLAATHREDARITVSDGYPYAEFYVSGVSAVDGSVVQSDRFFFFTPSELSIERDLPFYILCSVEPIPRDTSSNESLVWAERQIAKCNQDHTCLPSTQGSPLPSRILDVSFRDVEDSIRLLITTNQRERYVCLSHCWGDAASVKKTTLQNLNSHTKGIAIDELPKTFQDAVDITRRLGIDYLWIDSLCIIQNSKDDWETEASRMADIYEGAYLTIAVTASANSLEGCYRSSPPSIIETGFSYTTKQGLSSTIYCRQIDQHFDLDKPVPCRYEPIEKFPLLDRGWVFQERFLSPRMLHFCNPELVFECRDGARCQCNHTNSHYGFKGDLMRLFAQGPGLEDFQDTKGWWAVVSRYSRLRLTYDKDILTALSGISRRVGASQPTGDYVAGIWKSILPYGLLWSVHPRREEYLERTGFEFKQADAPRAPSWSWASVIAPIYWTLPAPWVEEEPLVKIHDISCEVSEVDAYGQAYGGVLSITGPTLTSNLRWHKNSRKFRRGQSQGVLKVTGTRTHALVSINHPFDYIFQFSAIPDQNNLVFYPDYPFFANKTGPWTVQCLWVMPTTILVLKSLEEPGVFERIGLLTSYITNDLAWEYMSEARTKSTLMTVKII